MVVPPHSPHHPPFPLDVAVEILAQHRKGRREMSRKGGEGSSSSAIYQGPLLSKKTKRKKHKRGKNHSLRVRASLYGKAARKFKVALRRKATRD